MSVITLHSIMVLHAPLKYYQFIFNLFIFIFQQMMDRNYILQLPKLQVNFFQFMGIPVYKVNYFNSTFSFLYIYIILGTIFLYDFMQF